MKKISLSNFEISNDSPMVIISGPCQMESRDHAMMMASELMDRATKLDIPFIFKTSFDKANRTSLKGKRGLGLEKSLEVFQEIKQKVGCPVLTDVHTESQCAQIAEVVDVIQIPAFLCRQTDLLLAAGKTGKIVNVKKGQFLSPLEATHIPEKVASAGNDNILLTERGTTFGYNNLVVDMRGPVIMKKTGYPIIIDATHAVMQPGGLGGASSGQREFAPVMARAAISLGIAGVFMESHQDPDNAPSDGPNMIRLSDIEGVWRSLKEFDKLAKQDPINV
ncbi:MAG: 3-deoxy-8-phosphooctulonate synthase [Rickettsiales bacterium]|nr:3-deoxy-8-phosphooctulonate synthase [Rickettsiales bacterium]|tara:strand:+ start:33209 stop:34042 length:834 start_codon:yes stop_codon:yes gene_type:complete